MPLSIMLVSITFAFITLSGAIYHHVPQHGGRRLAECYGPLPPIFKDGVCLGSGSVNSVYMATLKATGDRLVVRVLHHIDPKHRREKLVDVYRECAFVERLSQGWSGMGIRNSHLTRCIGTNARKLIDSGDGSEYPYSIVSNGGKGLFDFVHRDDWSLEKALSVLRQLLDVTGALRQGSWLHGDLWEENIGIVEVPGGLHVFLMDISEPRSWMVDDFYRVAMITCSLLYIPACEHSGPYKGQFHCVTSCHNTVGQILGWSRASNSLESLVGKVTHLLLAGPPPPGAFISASDHRSRLVSQLWRDLLSWDKSTQFQFLSNWHRVLVFGSRDDSVTFESFEQIVASSGIATLPSPPTMGHIVSSLVDSVNATSTVDGLIPKKESLGIDWQGCATASCMPIVLERMCELSRSNPGEKGCSRISAGLRANPSSLKCISACQYNSRFLFNTDDPWSKFTRRYSLPWAPHISELPLDEWLLCVDAQVSQDSCKDFVGLFTDRSDVPPWKLTPDTVDEESWREVYGEFTGWVKPNINDVGMVDTVEDCKQACLLHLPECNSISFDGTGCKLRPGHPPASTNSPGNSPPGKSSFWIFSRRGGYGLPPPTTNTNNATWIWLLAASVLLIAGSTLCIFILKRRARKAPLVEPETMVGSELVSRSSSVSKNKQPGLYW